MTASTPRERFNIYLYIYTIQQNKDEYVTENVCGQQCQKYSQPE